ncbi:QWRF motif-containing protein 7 [Ananas comosus]|uniref:QWRF motif-containing protein 7 n=1 Tax=Ananas comosus TaxID=4615 RepID=A0A199UMF1_ANACO|nr:QWRF motif-containing protein 7 [Ananas comosus]
MVQRRRQKMKLMRILNLQVQLLVRWEPLAKQHNEAVAVLGRVLGTACISLPLVEGAQANMVSLHRYFRESMGIMKDVEANTKTFYSKAETTNSILRELEEMILLEIEGLQQLVKLSKVITTLEMHELSLRAHLIQAMDDDDDDDDDISYLNY